MRKKGFTLIELLIVIAIIGILAVALVPTGMNALKKARDATRIAEINSLKTALELYALDNNNKCPGDNDSGNVDSIKDSIKGYLSGGIPVKDPSDNEYGYKYNTDDNFCIVTAELEITDGGNGNFEPEDDGECTDATPDGLDKKDIASCFVGAVRL